FRSFTTSDCALAFMRAMLAAAAICNWLACAATNAAAMDATPSIVSPVPRSGGNHESGDGVDAGAVGHRHDVAVGVDRRTVVEVDHRIEALRRRVIGLYRIHLLDHRKLIVGALLRGGVRELCRETAGRLRTALRNQGQVRSSVLRVGQETLDRAGL